MITIPLLGGMTTGPDGTSGPATGFGLQFRICVISPGAVVVIFWNPIGEVYIPLGTGVITLPVSSRFEGQAGIVYCSPQLGIPFIALGAVPFVVSAA